MRLIKTGRDKFIIVEENYEVSSGKYPENTPVFCMDTHYNNLRHTSDRFIQPFRLSSTGDNCYACLKAIAATPSPDLPNINFNGFEKELELSTFGIDIDAIVESEFKVRVASEETVSKKAMWRDGFDTALELNKKLFSLDDIVGMLDEISSFDGEYIDRDGDTFLSRYAIEKHIRKLLRPNEWSIEIEIEEAGGYKLTNGNVTITKINNLN